MVLLPFKNILGRSLLNELACVHDSHLIAHLGDNAEVMRDHDERCAHLFTQLVHHGQHLRLNGDIQSRCRLVSNQQLGLARQRNRDDHALLHTA